VYWFWLDLPSGVREQASKLSGVLGHSVGPRDGLAADASASPEPLLAFASHKAHELLGKAEVVEGDWPHAAAGANSGNLGTML